MKQLIVVQGPVATRSGYGNHTRDLVRSLIAMDKYDIKIIDTRLKLKPFQIPYIENEQSFKNKIKVRSAITTRNVVEY